MPALFHELATFAEFHLLAPLQDKEPPFSTEDTITSFLELLKSDHLDSHHLLNFPSSSPPAKTSFQYGSLIFYLLLLDGLEPSQARQEALTLTGDQVTDTKKGLRWTLYFENTQQAIHCLPLLKNAYAFRDRDRTLRISQKEERIILQTR